MSNVMIQYDITQIISNSIGFIVSTGITVWVYRVLNNTIKNLREDVNQLEKQVESLKKSEEKWYIKAQRLATILSSSLHCNKSDNCEVKKKYEEYLKINDNETK